MRLAYHKSINIGRRVVTGLDKDGKSTILVDGPPPKRAIDDEPHGRLVNWMWREEEIPASLEETTDQMESFSSGDWAKQKGILFGLFKWEPGVEGPFHVTQTVDIGLIISGKMEAILEKCSTVLGPGDCIVHRGTRHGWRVVGDEPMVMASVLIARAE